MSYYDLLKIPPFSLNRKKKDALLKRVLSSSFHYHYNNCIEYKRFCDKNNFHIRDSDFSLESFPFLPVQIFKDLQLRSVKSNQIVRKITSSATSSQFPSQIFLDHETRIRQMKTLATLLKAIFGPSRRPFIIMDIDPRSHISDSSISARTGAIRGFLTAASSATYVMSEDNNGKIVLDEQKLIQALKSIPKGQDFTIFGYTYVLYHDAVLPLLAKSIQFDLPRAKVVHIGGWKKLQDRAVSQKVFNRSLSSLFGTSESNIFDIYGFTEQLGIIYGSSGNQAKMCPVMSEIIIRDPLTMEPLPEGEEGLVQFITPLPNSYPGISILLDDIGKIVSRDGYHEGNHGTTFEIIGRAKKAEIRGCGDIMALNMASKQ